MKTLLLLCSLFATTTAFSQPYQPQAIWSREGAGDSSLYGSQILGLGDQNGDGYNDWAVYAFGWGPPGQINEAKVEFFHGGSPPDTVPYMVRTAQVPEEEHLWGARALGDLNGDGYTDWAIIVELTNDTLDRDIYKIYFGGPGSHDVPDLVLTAPWFSAYRGIGDFNGDGYDDLLLSDGTNNRASVLYGGNPMDTLPDWSRHVYLGGTFPGEVSGDRFSDFVSIATDDNVDLFLGGEHPDTLPAFHWDEYINVPAILPDISGDGVGDLAFGVAGGSEIRYGGGTIHASPDAFLHFPGCSPHVVVSAGDFNHDGFHDMAMVTEFCADAWYGKLAVHLGGPHLNTEPVFTVEGWTDPFNLIGIRSVANLGDVNGDHVDDLGAGANGDVAQAAWRGKVVIFRGDTSLHLAAEQLRPVLPQTLKITVFPNPLNSSATLSLEVPTNSRAVDVTVYNLVGQEVFRKKLSPVGSQVIYHYDAGGLSTGLYLLRASSGKSQTTTKLMVLR